MKKSPITTHILDTTRGRPAAGVAVELVYQGAEGWEPRGTGTTDADGRVADLITAQAFAPGTWQISFDTGGYFEAMGISAFYPYVSITFQVRATDEHYHVPLLLNPFGYSTYRGS